MNPCSESKHVKTKFDIILNGIALYFFIFINCCHKGNSGERHNALQGRTIFIRQEGCRFFQGDALACYQRADWTSFIFCHHCQFWFSRFTHQIITYSITLGLLTKIFKSTIKVTYSARSVFEFFLWELENPPLMH